MIYLPRIFDGLSQEQWIFIHMSPEERVHIALTAIEFYLWSWKEFERCQRAPLDEMMGTLRRVLMGTPTLRDIEFVGEQALTFNALPYARRVYLDFVEYLPKPQPDILIPVVV